MRRLLVGLVGFGVVAFGVRNASEARAPQAQAPSAGSAARGEYLANSVAMCVQCHTPRDRAGHLLEAQKFRGGAMPLQSPYPDRPFAFSAPNIAGLPGFTDEQVLQLLTEGKAEGRRLPEPPMPPFRMSREDALAIIAYLRTL
jgi:mono/diheme cytochrome c family protein